MWRINQVLHGKISGSHWPYSWESDSDWRLTVFKHNHLCVAQFCEVDTVTAASFLWCGWCLQRRQKVNRTNHFFFFIMCKDNIKNELCKHAMKE